MSGNGTLEEVGPSAVGQTTDQGRSEAANTSASSCGMPSGADPVTLRRSMEEASTSSRSGGKTKVVSPRKSSGGSSPAAAAARAKQLGSMALGRMEEALPAPGHQPPNQGAPNALAALGGMSVKEDSKAKLREAGRRKLEEFRKKKSINAASTSSSQPPAPTTSLENLVTKGRPTLSIETAGPSTPSNRLSISNLQPSGGDISAPSSAGLTPEQSGSSPPTGRAGDPLVDMLLLQVDSLMRERTSLQTEVETLRRENEQLQELVGYLMTGGGEEEGGEESGLENQQELYDGAEDNDAFYVGEDGALYYVDGN